MVEVNCNNFRNFVKCLEPVGDELLFQFSPNGILVKAIGQGNQMIIEVRMGMDTGFTGKIGMSLDMIEKLLPKEVPEVNIAFGKQSVITATGYKATIMGISEETCLRVPKKELVIEPGAIRVDAQQMHDRLLSLKKAFSGLAFTMTLDPEKPTMVGFSDFDSAMGSMNNSIIALTPVTGKDEQTYPYDIALPILNAIRLMSQGVDLRFMDMPMNDGCKALVIEGNAVLVNPDPDRKDTITFQYVVAPRVKE